MDGIKQTIRGLVIDAGFCTAGFCAPFEPVAPALLVAALPYGNSLQEPEGGEEAPEGAACIAPFARRNYYREAVRRLQQVVRECRRRFGGAKADYRILCNSPLPEKPPALACGIGVLGRNSLVITREAGSLVILAAVALPFALEPDPPLQADACAGCDPALPPCVKACPTGALAGDGSLIRERCIQWYASGNGETVPAEVAAAWGPRLYGCTACQDACICNRAGIAGTESACGPLPPYLSAADILAQTDGELKARFRGTALGMAWLGPAAIRRNAALALNAAGSANV